MGWKMSTYFSALHVPNRSRFHRQKRMFQASFHLFHVFLFHETLRFHLRFCPLGKAFPRRKRRNRSQLPGPGSEGSKPGFHPILFQFCSWNVPVFHPGVPSSERIGSDFLFLSSLPSYLNLPPDSGGLIQRWIPVRSRFPDSTFSPSLLPVVNILKRQNLFPPLSSFLGSYRDFLSSENWRRIDIPFAVRKAIRRPPEKTSKGQ